MTFKSVREKKYILKLIAKSYKKVHNPPKVKKVICSLIRPKISLIFFLIFIPEYRKIALCVITLLKKTEIDEEDYYELFFSRFGILYLD